MKNLLVLTGAGLALAGCEAPEPEANETKPIPQIVTPEDEAPPPEPLSAKDEKRVCKAALEALNGQKASTMKLLDAKEDGITRVTYNRTSDGKKWTYDCRILGGSVGIRFVDELGPGTGPSNWWKNTSVSYALKPGSVTITLQYVGETETTTEDIAI